MRVAREGALWVARYRLDKYEEDITPFRGREHEFHRLFNPYETLEREGNILVNDGINAIWNLVAGAGGTVFNNANAHIGVGDSTTAAAATQTDLQAATNKLRKAMNGGYPTSGTNQRITFQSSYASGEANFAWNEWAVFNAATAGTMLNRKVEALGTKTSGTWSLTVEITLA